MTPTSQPAPADTREAADKLRLRKQVLEVQQLEGKLVDRAKAVAHVRALAEAERNAWLEFPRRAGPSLAAELGADPTALEASLDRAVRQHLERIAEVRVEL